MADTSYFFSIQNDFPSHKVSLDRLAQEIRQSPIVIALSHLSTSGDVCAVVFKDPLSAGDETILDGLVATHSGEPLPNLQPKVQSDGALVVAQTGLTGSELIVATHDYCRKYTWFQSSVRVTDEALTDSGDGLTWDMANEFAIDLTHGYVLDEDRFRALVPHGYDIVVTVGGVPKTQREAYEAAGGDYTVDYAAGTITSVSGSWAGQAVLASYSYATNSTFDLIPASGRAVDINESEVQFSDDVDMNDSFIVEILGWVQVFAPELWDGFVPPGPLPTNTQIPLGTQVYKRVSQLVDEARGAFPVIPASGGAARGMAHATIGFPFQYQAVKRLWDKYGMVMRMRTAHDRVIGGEHATATFYCQSRNENEISE